MQKKWGTYSTQRLASLIFFCAILPRKSRFRMHVIFSPRKQYYYILLRNTYNFFIRCTLFLTHTIILQQAINFYYNEYKLFYHKANMMFKILWNVHIVKITTDSAIDTRWLWLIRHIWSTRQNQGVATRNKSPF